MKIYKSAPTISLHHQFRSDDGELLTPTNAQIVITHNGVTPRVIVPDSLVVSGETVHVLINSSALPLGSLTLNWSCDNAIDTQDATVAPYPYYSIFELREQLDECDEDGVDLVELREVVEARIESMCRRTFRPSATVERGLRPGKDMILPSESDVIEVISAAVNGVETPMLVNSTGTIDVVTGYLAGGDVVDVEYIHGAPFNAEIKRACILLARDLLINRPSNVTSQSLDGGLFQRFVVGGAGDALTSVPEVNEIVSRYRRAVISC